MIRYNLSWVLLMRGRRMVKVRVRIAYCKFIVYICTFHIADILQSFFAHKICAYLFYIYKQYNQAHDLTMEGGQIVAPFPRDHLEKYMRTCKARVSLVYHVCVIYTIIIILLTKLLGIHSYTWINTVWRWSIWHF